MLNVPQFLSRRKEDVDTQLQHTTPGSRLQLTRHHLQASQT